MHLKSGDSDTDIERFKRVLEIWNRLHDPLARIRECDLAWNLGGQDLVAYREENLDGTPIIYGIATQRGIASGLSPSSAWLSLWGEIPAGREPAFVTELCSLANRLGKSRVAIGADEFHFVPGVPLGTPQGERLAQALRGAGFEGAEAADFLGDIQSDPVVSYLRETLTPANRERWSFKPILSEEDQDGLEAFLDSEFRGRWTREFKFWRSRQDTARAFWSVLRKREPGESGAIFGFARMALRGRMTPTGFGWTPGALRLPLRAGVADVWQANDSCLGPIGVAASQRGQGAGRVLLAFVLETLQRIDAGRVCIDWTDAFKYYYPLCFERGRQYWTAWKSGPF